ncbi:MAG: polysaccharide biosynthesis tyrosine autokinase [Gemmatimonadaceae bacterium]
MTTPENTTQYAPPDEGQFDDISLAEMFGVLWDAKWFIAAIAGGIFLVVFLYALLAAPVYTPSALLQVNQKSGALSGLETLSSMLEGSALPVDAEIQLIRSRSVLTAAVNTQHADIRVDPRHFPLVGGFVARYYRGVAPARPWLGLSSYSWGGDRIEVTSFDIPRDLYGKDFHLTVTGPDSYRLQDPAGNTLLNGRAGVFARADSQPGAPRISIQVSSVAARPGVTFTIQREALQESLKRIGKHLAAVEQGTQSGILQVTLSGGDPDAAANLLTAIVNADVDLNRALRAQQAASQIGYLEQQLPTMEERVAAARRQLGEYQARHRVLDLSDESKALLDRLGALDQAASAVALQRAQLEQQFGGSNPTLKAVRAQEQALQRQRDTLEAMVAQLPTAAQAVLQLQENLLVASSLYTGLLTSIQQLQVVRAGTVGDLSIVDLPAVPDKPSGPARLLILMLGAMLAVIAGASAAFVRRAFLQGVEDPAVLESRFRLPVLTVVPYSKEQTKRENALDGIDREPLLAQVEPHDLAVEALRTLRTSLQFLLARADRPILCVSGPVSGVGKSFIAANLARLIADADKRVLVVDADMRRGHLYRYFGVPPEPGLSQLLSAGADLAQIVRTTDMENLKILTAGIYPPNPAELLLLPAFAALLEQAAREFDLVIIDSPPILPVTDAVIVAQQASMNLIVARSRSHTVRDLDAAMARYRQNGIRLDGFVFNFLRAHTGRYGYQYGY